MEHARPLLLWILDHPLVWLVIMFGGMALLEFSVGFYRSLQLAPAGMPLPAPPPKADSKPSRPNHNVQCLGVTAGEKAAQIGFRNAEIPNQEIGNFHSARLRIRYTLAESPENEVALVYPARWIGSDEDRISIGFVPQFAVIAVYVGEQWHGVSTVEVFTPQSEIESYYRRELTPLPNAQLRIEATLIGDDNLSLVPFTGILTLGGNGVASFSPDA